MFDEMTLVADRLEGRQYFACRVCSAGASANRRLLRFKIDYDCQHTRCCTNGLFGLRRSGMSRHSFDADHGTIHVSRDAVTAGDEVRHHGWEEEQDDDANGDGPKDEFVKGDQTGLKTRSVC